jgi:hypothetical protein
MAPPFGEYLTPKTLKFLHPGKKWAAAEAAAHVLKELLTR